VRDWKLTIGDPLLLRYAADCRLTRTDYTNDQSWEVALGAPQEPALAVQSRYGGRAGLARIVPMWIFPGRAVFEASAYAEPVTLRAFAPNYAKFTTKLLPTLALTFELWVMDSHAVGGRFTLTNETQAAQPVRLDLVPQIAREGKLERLTRLTTPEGHGAVTLGAFASMEPVLLLEGADLTIDQTAEMPKLYAPLEVPAGGTVQVRWVHAGEASLEASLREGQRWLTATDWDAAFALIDRINSAGPEIDTGDIAVDAALAFSLQTVLRSFLSASSALPFPSPVGSRTPSRGYGGTSGTNHPSNWMGQNAADVWMAAPTAALAAPDLARGALRNFRAVQGADGWIDGRPGLGGARGGLMAAPLIVATVQAIYNLTEDKHFLTEIYGSLQSFYQRWFGSDMDRDRDGVPEWATPSQAMQPESPVFNRFRRWSANAEISKAETPDLLALLLHEAEALTELGRVVGREAAAQNKVSAQLQTLWNPERSVFQSRDRDTHLSSVGGMVFSGKGDEWFTDRKLLEPAGRLLIRIMGGQNTAPNLEVRVEGMNANGDPIMETLPTSAFVWYSGLGTAITEEIYADVRYIKCERLSRVFQVEVSQVRLDGVTLANRLPLLAGATDEQTTTIIQDLTKNFLHAAGLSFASASDLPDLPADNPNNAVSMLWNALFVEALLARGQTQLAVDLIQRLLQTEVRALKSERALFASYHAEGGAGSGESDTLSGIFPVHLYLRAAGVRVVNNRRVWAGGPFPFSAEITVRQRGITITRSSTGTRVRFPSGTERSVGAEWQLIEDPEGVEPEVDTVVLPPPLPAPVEPPLPEEPPRTYKIPVRRVAND